MGFTMKRNKLLLALSISIATTMTGCGSDGDADKNVVRDLFAVGDTFEGVEDGDPITGNVGENDQGEGLTFALQDGENVQNGTLEFNADGSFMYTPNPDFYGVETVTYIATQESSGQTDWAKLNFDVENDFEHIGEYGWNLVWADEFDGEDIDYDRWTADNASLADGSIIIDAIAGNPSTLASVEGIRSGRVEARIMIPEGGDLTSVFALMPMADMYAGYNALTLLENRGKDIIAGAHYGLDIINAVKFNDVSKAGASADYHTYAVEWNEEEIRWYIDGIHSLTVNTLNTWAYTDSGESLTIDNDGPFNQNLQIMFNLTGEGDAPVGQIAIDYVNVYACDLTVAPDVDNCASYVDKSISKEASDRIESLGPISTELFADGYFDKKSDEKLSDLTPLQWHYTDEIGELAIAGYNDPQITAINLDNDRDLVLDVLNESGDANIAITAPGVELIGRDAVVTFDMFIDSTLTAAETIDIKMETGWPYLGMLTWNLADLELDTWVTYSVPVSEFVNNPFLAPDWLTWIPGVGEGDPLPLDTNNINALLVIEFQDAIHLQLDNVSVDCVSNENCFQGPMAIQPDLAPEAPSTLYEAEDFIASGDVALEDTADEGGGQNVGWIDAGDFLEYTIVAASDGEYSLDYRIASSGGSDGFEVSIAGTLVDGQDVPDTGGWQNWETISSDKFTLAAGDHTMRIDFVGGAINFNWFKLFEPVFEILVEAENYLDAGDVALEDTADEGGGQNVGWIDPGDFLEYTVNIPADGTYKITYRIASSGGSDGFETSVGGVVVDSQSVADTGGWQNWETQTSTVDLLAGEQTLRLDFVGGAINLNWIKITN